MRVCVKCGGRLEETRTSFQGFPIDGYKCMVCSEEYFDPIRAEEILQFNKVLNKSYDVTIGKIGSNHIIRIPAKVSMALGIKKGEKVKMSMCNENELVIKRWKNNLKELEIA